MLCLTLVSLCLDIKCLFFTFSITNVCVCTCLRRNTSLFEIPFLPNSWSEFFHKVTAWKTILHHNYIGILISFIQTNSVKFNLIRLQMNAFIQWPNKLKTLIKLFNECRFPFILSKFKLTHFHQSWRATQGFHFY